MIFNFAFKYDLSNKLIEIDARGMDGYIAENIIKSKFQTKSVLD